MIKLMRGQLSELEANLEEAYTTDADGTMRLTISEAYAATLIAEASMLINELLDLDAAVRTKQAQRPTS